MIGSKGALGLDRARVPAPVRRGVGQGPGPYAFLVDGASSA
jgi:hypothetical protein